MKSDSNKNDALILRANAISRATLFFLVLALVLCFSIHKIESRDFGWLLKTGEHIYETHSVPRTELFSFTAQGNKYIDSHWLFQLLLYVCYRAGGIPGATLFAACIMLAAFATVYFIGYDKEKYGMMSAFIIAAIIMTGERFLVRPFIVTILFLAVYFLILERYKTHGGRAIFLLPLFQLIWVNMHGLFVLGLIMPAVYLGVGLTELRFKPPWVEEKAGKPHDAKALRPLAAMLAIMFCESFLNPYTIDVALYPITLFREVQGGANVVAGSVAELASPLSGTDPGRAVRYFRWMIWIVPITFVLNWRKLNLTHAILFGVFLYLSLIARRNLDLFSVIAIPIAVINLNGFLDDLPRYFKEKNIARSLGIGQLILSPLLMAGMLLLIVRVATDRYFLDDRDLTRFGFGVAAHAHPVKAANFIDAANLGGEMFNDPSIGGYLIWRLFPERRVYFDGRWEVYGDEFFENFKLVSADPSVFEAQVESMGIGYAVFPHKMGHMRRLLAHMTESPDWELVHFDEISIVFARNIPENEEAIEQYAIDFANIEMEIEKRAAERHFDIADPHFSGTYGVLARLIERIPRTEYPFEQLARANFYFTHGYHDTARTLYEQSLKIYRDSEMAHERLGRIYWKNKMYGPALAEFEEVERLNPRSAANLTNLGGIYLALGDTDEAEAYLKRAKRLDRNSAIAPLQLGKTYLLKGQREKAAIEFRRALELDSDSKEARELLEQTAVDQP
jgi:tetratricopeptide (TPR) repeat protein